MDHSNYERKMTHHAVLRNSSAIGSMLTLADYSPSVFLRCHIQKDNDSETKIWKCAFEPSLEKPGETTNMLATCGGKSICIIDVETQQVVKRFQDIDRNENFYTLAWSTIEAGSRKKVNILAVAGEGGAVKLIHPGDLVMYSIIRGHKKYISCLLFHPTYTRLLFSGSKDGFVFLWDIGIPDKVPLGNYMPLLKISLQDTVGDALNLVFSERSQLLIAGAERGCVGWIVTDYPSLTPVRRARVIEKADITFRHTKLRTLTVDGLIILPGDFIATKQFGSGEILIWDLAKHVEKDQKEVLIEPLIKLKHPQHLVKYLNLGYSNGLLGVGDNRGNLLLYDIKELINKHHSEDEEHVLESSIILMWPNVVSASTLTIRQETVVNTVAIGSNHKFIIGGTDNNLVCIWKRDDEETPREELKI